MRRTFLSITETCDLLKLSERTVRQYIADGLLPAYRIGPKTVRIAEDDLDTFTATRRIPTVRA